MEDFVKALPQRWLRNNEHTTSLYIYNNQRVGSNLNWYSEEFHDSFWKDLCPTERGQEPRADLHIQCGEECSTRFQCRTEHNIVTQKEDEQHIVYNKCSERIDQNNKQWCAGHTISVALGDV